MLLYGPGLDFVAAFWGCLYAGVVAVPAYPPKPGDRTGRLQALADDCQPRAVLTTATALATARTSGVARDLAAAAERCWLATDEIGDCEADAWRRPRLAPDDVALLQYTSGSTSDPRGVLVSHANLVHNEEMIRHAFDQSPASVVVSWLPLYHDMGLIGGVLQPVYSGARCILMSPMAFLQQPVRWLKAVSRFRATTSGGPDFAYDLCVRKVAPEQRAGLDLSSWTTAFNGAEPVRAETIERFVLAFGPCGFRREAFYPCYGLAEATLFVAGGRPGEPPRFARADDGSAPAGRRLPAAGSGTPLLVGCGGPRSGQRLVIADPASGVARRAGEVGEIWVAGPSVGLGYWQRRQESERCFNAHLATGEGPYLRTGDLGFLRDGELFVTGRLKDLIIWRGRNVYPQDLERTAERSHSALRPGCGAAFTVPGDPQEAVVLIVEIAPRREAEAEEAAEAVRGAVAEAHEVQVQEVLVVAPGAVPRTSSGKVRRRACRELCLIGELPVVARSTLAAESGSWTQADGAPPAVPAPAAGGPGEPADHHHSPSAAPAALEALLRHELSRAARRDLGVIPREERLSRLGLDSLAAVELAQRLEAAGFPVAPEELLAGPTLGELALRLSARPPLAGPHGTLPGSASADAGGDGALLSYGERALWFLDRVSRESEGAYNVGGAVRIRGAVHPEALGRAVQGLIDRHASLRTTFPAPGGEPRRQVREHLEVAIVEQDASGLDGRALADRLLAELERPFDLAAGPLVRLHLFGSAPDQHVLLFSAHHICCDFWSLAVAARELAALYSTELGDAAAALPLAGGDEDFARRQRLWLASPEGEAHWAYWREQLGGELPDLALPADRPRPAVQTFRGGWCQAGWGAAAGETPRALGRVSGTTVSTVLLAAFMAALGRITGQQDLVVGSPTACRRSARSAAVVGYRVNPVALRGDLRGDPSFAELLDRLHSTVLAAHAHQEYPFPLLAERLRRVRDASRSPIFQALFAYHQDLPSAPSGLAALATGAGGVPVRLGPLDCESLPVRPRGSQFDLSLAAAELASGFALALTYNRDLFDGASVQRFAGHLLALLAGAVERPASRLSELPLLAAPERHQLVWEHNDTRRHWPADQRTVQGLVSAQARRTPDAVAIVFAGEALSYRQLDRRATRLARRLRSLGLGPDDLVGLCVERSLEMVWGLLGILGSGAAYLPLDPGYPAERLAFMLADSAVPVLLTRRSLLPTLPVREGQVVLCLDDPELLAGVSDRPLAVDVDPRCLAYAIYTSGSTGRPKAALNTHRGIVNRLLWMQETFRLGAADRVLHKTPLSFDVSVWELFWPLLAGARMVVCAPGRHGDPGYLRWLIVREAVTTVHFVPSMLEAFLDRAEAGSCPGLRRVICSGEALSFQLQERCLERLDAGLWNLYGPTEAAVDVSCWRCERGTRGRVPIGRPIANLALHLLDPALRPVPLGVTGELYIAGTGLARGYLRRPDLTAERFLPHPDSGEPGAVLYRTGDLARRLADGAIEFLGRADGQIKVRGFRIELGEIEAVLHGHPAVRGAAAALRQAPDGELRLAAYVVGTDGPEEIDTAALRRYLAARLPEPTIPAIFVGLPVLPLTPSGKLDRRALPEPDWSAGSPAGLPGYRTPAEEIVANALAGVLGRERIGGDDDFFALGGHSLLAVRALAAIGEALDRDLPATALFSHPTAARLTSWIEASGEGTPAGAGPAPPPLRRRALGPELPLSFAQRRIWFLDHLEPGTPLYNCPIAVRLQGDFRPPLLAAALAEIARRHDVLRTVFEERGGEPVQRVLPPVESTLPRLAVVDLSALPAAARGSEEQRLRREEACGPFDLARGPLLRAAALKLGEREYVGLVTLHHIASDDWSLGVLVHELSALYTAFAERRPSPLPELAVQYADFASWQREWLTGEVLEDRLRYWRDQLAGAPSRLALPTDRNPELAGPRGALRCFELPAETCQRLEALSRAAHTSLFMTLLAAFQTLLYRCCGQADLVVGVDVANRTRSETEPLIGFFVNLLPLRGDLRGNPTFEELLRRTRRAALGALAHQDLPFEKLVEELRPERVLGQTPLVRAIFSFRPAPREPLRLPGVEASPLPPWEGFAKRDLTLFMERLESGLGGAWSYRTDLFDAPAIDRLAGRFETLLDSVVGNPGSRLDSLVIEPRASREQRTAAARRRRDQKLSKLLEIDDASRAEEDTAC